MARSTLTLVALFAAGCGAVFGYSYATRQSSSAASAERLPVATVPVTDTTPAPSPPPLPVDAGVESAAEPQSPSASAIAQWIAEADGDDATARMTAITALGTAPRSDALPALQKVLNSGQTTEDRQLALQSMRTLALKHGDADGTIRNSVRQAIYHLDDAVVVTTAQEVLDQLESAPVG